MCDCLVCVMFARQRDLEFEDARMRLVVDGCTPGYSKGNTLQRFKGICLMAKAKNWPCLSRALNSNPQTPTPYPLQGYLSHEKQRPPRTIRQNHAYAPSRARGGGVGLL